MRVETGIQRVEVERAIGSEEKHFGKLEMNQVLGSAIN